MKLRDSPNSYRQIFKATSIFGGVQVFNILINIIRSKFIAVLLGPEGMGIVGLLNDTINLIRGLTACGLGTSAVKNVAIAHASGDEQRIGEVVAVIRKWVWVTGLLGFIVALGLSPWLSQLAFGNGNYTLAFALLSVTLLLSQISVGQGVILQGMRQIRYLAQAGLTGSALGLITSIPLYYYFGRKGIVPAIIVTSLTTLILTWYFAQKVKIKRVAVSLEKTIVEGKSMLSLGFMLTLSGLITLGVSYLVRIFISKKGGLADVGLYNAGFAIINSYVGLIFTAMATDYYPRLSGVAHDNVKAAKEINQQAEIALLIIAPILCVFLVYINWAVILLYSNKFTAVNAMIHWAALGMFFKAASWAVGFLLLAKGASKVFFWNELISNIYLLGLNLLGYYYYGLTGLGVSFMIAYFIYLVQLIILTKRLYNFQFHAGFLRLFAIQFSLALACFVIIKFTNTLQTYIFGSIVIIASTWYSIYEIDKRIGLQGIFTGLKHRFTK
ncbi:MAG: O-antigen translocase [Ginsengibacter sp.]